MTNYQLFNDEINTKYSIFQLKIEGWKLVRHSDLPCRQSGLIIRIFGSVILYLSLFLALALPSLAFRLDKIEAVSDFHLGLTTGIGTGLNFGASAKFLPYEIKPGIEIEQLITDFDYSATINGLKMGFILNILIDKNIYLNGHYGNSQFRANKNILYKDIAGINQTIVADQLTMGSYWGVSLDFLMPDWGILVSPKYLVNTIKDQGAVSQFDLNIGKTF